MCLVCCSKYKFHFDDLSRFAISASVKDDKKQANLVQRRIFKNKYVIMNPFLFFIFLFFLPKAIEHPVRTNLIPRQIPEQSFYTKPLPGIVMGGILPFGCIFIQLFFILNSIW